MDMHETHSPHFFHDAALVKLGDVEFFADSTSLHVSDNHVGQALCGFAFDAGRDAGHRPKNDYELSGWNNAGAGI